jgi:hypothetical protein
MLSCKDVVHSANDRLNKNDKLNWKIHLHLLVCSHCRRFTRHLKITQKIAPQMVERYASDLDAEGILKRIKEQSRSSL